MKEGDSSQEEEVTLKTTFMNENLDISMEELKEPMKIIHEKMKNTPQDHTYY